MKVYEELKRELLNEELERDYPNTWELLNETADLLEVYYTQCKAAMKSKSLGLCKSAIKHALEEDI